MTNELECNPTNEELNILKAIKKNLESLGFEFANTHVDNSWNCYYGKSAFQIKIERLQGS